MELLVERKQRILNITLNRPEKRNTLTSGMCLGIVDAINSAQDGQEVGVILLSATGHVFCAGMDLDEAVAMDHTELAAIHDKLFTIGLRSKKPIVISVNGAALGSGLGLVAQGHLVTASSGAAFGVPEIKMGLWPVMIYRSMEAALGVRRMLELSLTGRLFYAPEALQWGLVHAVCPSAEVLDRGRGFAADLAKASPQAVAIGLEYLQLTRGKSGDEVGQIAQATRCKLMDSGDFREGFTAFQAKRKPQWPSMPSGYYDGAAQSKGELAMAGRSGSRADT